MGWAWSQKGDLRESDIALVVDGVLGALPARAPVEVEAHLDPGSVPVLHEGSQVGEFCVDSGCAVQVVLRVVDTHTAPLPAFVDADHIVAKILQARGTGVHIPTMWKLGNTVKIQATMVRCRQQC